MLRSWAVTYLVIFFTSSVMVQTEDMVRVNGGAFVPFYSSTEDPVEVDPFWIDAYPVTNADFLEFVRANPKWQRSNVKSVFADENYLRHWGGDLDLGPEATKIKHSPVTNISWFAARAYAKWKGKRLPTLNEWEFVASAGKTKPNAARDKKFVQQILDWYSKPNPETLPPVGRKAANFYGVYDLHGLIWEWVRDFNTVFIVGESRKDQGDLKQFYCAAGNSAASETDKENYAAFLRYSFRGSLEANYAVGNLGFRCVKSID